MKSSRFILLPILMLLIGLPSCFKIPQYRKKSLSTIHSHFPFVATENNVIVQVKCLDDNEKQQLFGQRSSRLYDQKLNEPLRPLYISVHNLSNRTYYLTPKNIDLTLTSYKYAAQCMKKSSIGKAAKAISTGTGIFLGTSLSIICYLFMGYNTRDGGRPAKMSDKVLIPLISLIPTVGFGTLFASGFQLLRNAQINTRIRHDLREKTIHKKTIIYSGQQFDGLIFVKQSDYRKHFSLTLIDTDKHKNTITFDINLNKDTDKQDNLVPIERIDHKKIT